MKLLFFFFLSSFSLKNYTLSMSFTQPVMKTLLSSCLFLSLLIPITEAQPQVLCNRDNNYTQGSPYQSNLKLVINSLVSNITTSGFYMTTSAGTVPDKVYGLLQCRAGISNDVCQSCANNASAEVVKQCSYNKEGIFMQYETCVVRYAGTNFFGTLDVRVSIWFATETASDQVVFRNELYDLLDKLSAKAASDPTRLSSGSNFTKNDIYGMVQCTRDLSEASCLKCLQRVRLEIKKEKVGGLYLSPSCFIKYEIYPFFGIPESSSPPTDANPTNQGYVEMDISYTNSFTFHLNTLRVATKNFSESNNFGEGGFGSV